MKSGRLLFCLSCTFTLGVLAQNKDSIRIAIDNYEYEKVLELTSCTDSLDEECTEFRLQACKELNKWVRNSTNGKPHFRYSRRGLNKIVPH